jgi:cytochrome P450
VVTDGEEHDRRRRLLQPAFSTRAVHAHVPLMVEEVGRALCGWRPGQCVDAYQDLRTVVRRIVVRALFGNHLQASADRLGELLQPMIDFVNRLLTTQIKLNVPGTLWHRARRAKAQADALVFDAITRARRAGDGGEPDDVLATLVAASEDGYGLSDAEIRDQVVSLIAAGYDTTSGAAGWLVYELLRQPEVWATAADEAKRVIAHDVLRDEHLSQLPYIDGVINEVLRLHPPGVISGRYVVEPIALAGYTIPAGRRVLYSPYVTHRLPELWRDPERFSPLRWDKTRPGYRESAPYSFVPFGGAYRRCIGFGLATIELKVICTELVRHTELALATTDIRPTSLVAMHPLNGVPVNVVSAPIRRLPGPQP